MAQEITPEVLIDGAVPRSLRDRCETLVLWYANQAPHTRIKDHIWRRHLSDWNAVLDGDDATDETYIELEDEIISEINTALPDNFVCTVGEQEPGDVLIREIGSADEEMK